MRFNTPFIWAYFAPVILINLVSYISVFHNQSSKIWTLEVGFYHSELSVQRTTIERTTGAIEYQKEKLMSYCARYLFSAQRALFCS